VYRGTNCGKIGKNDKSEEIRGEIVVACLKYSCITESAYDYEDI
jgi:hypothetical protein